MYSTNMNEYAPNLPNKGEKKRIVIVGGGFAGLETAKKLENSGFQIVLLDKNNYHQFQPLFYQVATAGLEPSSIAFPLRKLFQNKKNIHIRVTEVYEVLPESNTLLTSIGTIEYDYLILGMGGDTNFFGNERIRQHAIPMKSVGEALFLRNRLLENYEKALITTNVEERKSLLNIVVVGGGPTGVEVSGALYEMKKFVLPKDIPELNFEEMEVTLLEAGGTLLNGMSEESRSGAQKFLEDMGVKVKLNTLVKDFDGNTVYLADGSTIKCHTLIWAAGITGNTIKGMPEEVYTRGNRIVVNRFNAIPSIPNIFVLGDGAYMEEEKFPKGHPQVAQVAIQMGKNLANNLKRTPNPSDWKAFTYKDLGSMATIGRNKAVVDLPFFKFQGFFAWLVWMFIHLLALIGSRNRIVVFINWVTNYLSYDQSLRLIIRTKEKFNPQNAANPVLQ